MQSVRIDRGRSGAFLLLKADGLFMASIMEDLVPEPEVWAARLRKFVDECMESAASEEADRIRQAIPLLQCGALLGACEFGSDPASLEAMLACDAPESTVFTLLPAQTAFMLSRGQGTSCLATIIVGEEGGEVIAEGATLSLSLLAAYMAGLLLMLEGGYEGNRPSDAGTTARLH